MKISGFFAVLFSLLCLAPASLADTYERINEQFYVGLVKSVTSTRINKDLLAGTGMISRGQELEVEVLEGPLRGRIFDVHNELTDNPAYNVTVKPGQEVILSVVTESGGQPEINLADYHRSPVLMWLGIAFLAVFLFFG